MRHVSMFLLGVGMACTGAYAATESQSFDSSAAAAAAGWTVHANGTDLGTGWSNTTNAGGASAGEAKLYAGIDVGEASYYADTTVGTLNPATTALSASGWVNASASGDFGTGVTVGFFNVNSTQSTVDSWNNSSYLGLTYFKPYGFDGYFAWANPLPPYDFAFTASGTSNMPLYFTIDWTPGVSSGTLAVSIDDDPFDANPAVSASLVRSFSDLGSLSYDAFGIFNPNYGGPSSGDNFTGYLDGVTYTSAAGPIPEPASLSLLGLAGLAALRRRRMA